MLWLISLLQGTGSSSLAVWTWSRLTTPLWCFLTLCLLDYWLPLPFAFSLFMATSFSSCSLNASLPSCLCFLSHSPSFIPTIFFCFSHAVLFLFLIVSFITPPFPTWSLSTPLKTNSFDGESPWRILNFFLLFLRLYSCVFLDVKLSFWCHLCYQNESE